MRLINEAGLARAVKSAYRKTGYFIFPEGDRTTIFSDYWCVMCPSDLVPRRVLAVIVEHAGLIPDFPAKIVKDMDAQMMLREEAAGEAARWAMRSGESEIVTMVPIVMQGLQIFQPEGGGACYGTSMFQLGIVEQDAAEHGSAVAGYSELCFSQDDERVMLPAVRKAESSWAKAWERAVWTALESVDLHKTAEE